VDAQNDDRYQASRLVRTRGACCVGLYPVVVDNVAVGCLYFGRITQVALPSPATLATLGHLRDVLTEFIRHTRPHS
jgi:hypothetical protein